MFSGLGRVVAFYNFGKKNCNRKGWLKSPRLNLEGELSGKVYVVTGSNSGIGKCLTEHLFSRGATVYMVCRSKERALAARDEIVKQHSTRPGELLKVVVADVSLQSEVEKAVAEIAEQETVIDCLVCNAGALLDKKNMTKDGVELTFACHFLFGTYWLGKMAMDLLSKSKDPRIVIITSGGMYTSKLGKFDKLVTGEGNYDGQAAYANAKRCQVVLAEQWAKEFPEIKVVSTHPGWTSTPGVDKAYGSFSQWLLSPLRSEWEGTEGIAWNCSAPGEELKSGELYLDGQVQPKYLHKSTEHSPKDVETFMEALHKYEESKLAKIVSGAVSSN